MPDRIPSFHSEAPLSTQGRGVEGAALHCMRLKAPGAGLNSQPFKDLHLATGTTWIQEIVDLIEQSGDVDKCQWAAIQHRHPFLEWARPPQPSGECSSPLPHPQPGPWLRLVTLH